MADDGYDWLDDAFDENKVTTRFEGRDRSTLRGCLLAVVITAIVVAAVMLFILGMVDILTASMPAGATEWRQV